jgi:hypothetical protein
VRETLSLGLGLSSDLDTDVLGQPTQRDSVDLNLRWASTETRSTAVHLGWNHRGALYNQQRQDQLTASITHQAAFSERVVVFATLQGVMNRSNTLGLDYVSMTVSAGGSVRW